MSLKEIKELRVQDLSHDATILYLWVTAPKLPEGLEVLNAWGFTYTSGMMWDKMAMGRGFWSRVQHEHVLIGRRKKSTPPPVEHRIRSVIRSKRRKNSQKPDALQDWIDRAWPDAKKAELFARRPREGWVTMGSEVSGLTLTAEIAYAVQGSEAG